MALEDGVVVGVKDVRAVWLASENGIEQNLRRNQGEYALADGIKMAELGWMIGENDGLRINGTRSVREKLRGISADVCSGAALMGGSDGDMKYSEKNSVSLSSASGASIISTVSFALPRASRHQNGSMTTAWRGLPVISSINAGIGAVAYWRTGCVVDGRFIGRVGIGTVFCGNGVLAKKKKKKPAARGC